MTEDSAQLASVTRAKEQLKASVSENSWYRGVGIARSKSGFMLRLNVDADADVTEDELPESVGGFEVEVVFIHEYKPREGGNP